MVVVEVEPLAQVPLDGDTVPVRGRHVAERVLPDLHVMGAGDAQAQGDVLAGLEEGQAAAVDGLEGQGNHVAVVGLALLLLDDELAPPGPGLVVLVDLGLAGGEHARHEPVGLGPGQAHVGGHGGAQHGGEGPQQELPHDVVVLGLDVQRRVLLRHPLHHRDQLADVADVGRERQDQRRERPRLRPVLHVDRVEVVVQLRVVPQHRLVEDGRDVLSVFFQSRYRPLDQLGLLVGEGHGDGGGT